MPARIFRRSVLPLLVLTLAALLPGSRTPAADKEPPARDRYGDPLPPHALARIGTSRLHHGGPITFIAFAPDGKTFVTASQDRTVSIWELETGKEVLRVGGQTREVLSAVFSADGKRLHIVAADGTARVVEAGEGKELHRFSLKADALTCAAFSSDRTTLASGDENGGLRTWDVKERKPLREVHHEGAVRRVAVDGENMVLASTSGTNGIQTWDYVRGEKLRSFGHGAYSSLAFGARGKLLAAGDFENVVTLWRPSGEKLGTCKGHREVMPFAKNGVSCVAVSPDGGWVASGAGDATVRVWNAGTLRQEWLFEGHTERVTALAYAPDGRHLVSGAADSGVRVWDTQTGKEVRPPAAPAAAVLGLALSPDGKLAATLDGPAGNLNLWDARTGEPAKRFAKLPRAAGGVAISPDGKTLAVGLDTKHFEFRDVGTGEPRDGSGWTGADNKQALDFAPGLVFDADGRQVAAVSSSGLFVSIWEPATGKRVAQITAAGGKRAGSVAFAPDGRLLATAGKEAAVRLWDLPSGFDKGSLPGHSGGTLAVAFAPTGGVLASGGKDRMIRVWELASGQERRVFGGQPGWVHAAAFAPDGRVLATGNADGTVRLWDWRGGRLLHELPGHRGAVTRLAFSAKGEILASASVDATVLVWDAAALVRDFKPAAIKLSARELETAWENLASSDPATAGAALQSLARTPEQTLPLLGKHVQPLTEERLTQLLKDLDSDDFTIRDKAAKELALAGKFAEPALRSALKGEPSAEVRRSVTELLDKLKDHKPAGGELRLLRGLEVLEMIDNEEARQLLEHVAGGARDSELTRQAKAALDRLRKRPASMP